MKTQIYATFGPACRKEHILKEMIKAGMTGIRLNLSHTTLLESEDYILAYQKVAKECGVKPQILIDMQGPELRIGNLQEPIFLKEEEEIVLAKEEVILKESFFNGIKVLYRTIIPIPEIVIKETFIEDELLLDDGKIKVKVIEVRNDFLKAIVLRGGVLLGRKSIKNVNRNIKMPVLTKHDIENIRFAKKYGITALMQPFVLNKEDLTYVRTILRQYDAEDILIFAKIENQIGVKNLEQILPNADVLIIARGDLGNDMPLWELPRVQKEIEMICKKYNKPYIVVTQMLASMEQNPVPTRAEVSDIFHAVYHGAYGVMITGESAIGKYPVEAVSYLTNTAKEAENMLF